MTPKDVQNHILENFDVGYVRVATGPNGRHRFYVTISEDVRFSSYQTYCNGSLEQAINHITSVLIKMGLERDQPRRLTPIVETVMKKPTLDEEFPVQPNGFRFL